MILVMTIAYQRAGFVREAIECFQANSDRSEYDMHVLVDPGYPIPDSYVNSQELIQLCEEKDLKYLQIANRGCHKNWDFVSKRFRMGEGDILVGVCPDTRCTQPGWVKAGVEVLRADQDCFTVQLNRPGDYTPYSPEVRVVGGHEVIHFPNLVAWSCGMFNMGLISQVGGFDAYNKHYGYSEHWLVDRLVPMGKRWYFLKNHYDTGPLSPDLEYTQWKIESAGKRTDKSFEDWFKILKIHQGSKE